MVHSLLLKKWRGARHRVRACPARLSAGQRRARFYSCTTMLRLTRPQTPCRDDKIAPHDTCLPDNYTLNCEEPVMLDTGRRNWPSSVLCPATLRVGSAGWRPCCRGRRRPVVGRRSRPRGRPRPRGSHGETCAGGVGRGGEEVDEVAVGIAEQ